MQPILANRISIMISLAWGAVLLTRRLLSHRDDSPDLDDAQWERREKVRAIQLWTGSACLIFGLFRLAVPASANAGASTVQSSGGYSVTFPAPVQEQIKTQRFLGENVQAHVTAYRDATLDCQYEVTYLDKPFGSRLSADSVVGLMTSKWGAPASRRTSVIDDHNCQELVFTPGNDHRAHVRIYNGQEKLFWIITNAKDTPAANTSARQFFDSQHFKH